MLRPENDTDTEFKEFIAAKKALPASLGFLRSIVIGSIKRKPQPKNGILRSSFLRTVADGLKSNWRKSASQEL